MLAFRYSSCSEGKRKPSKLTLVEGSRIFPHRVEIYPQWILVGCRAIFGCWPWKLTPIGVNCTGKCTFVRVSVKKRVRALGQCRICGLQYWNRPMHGQKQFYEVTVSQIANSLNHDSVLGSDHSILNPLTMSCILYMLVIKGLTNYKKSPGRLVPKCLHCL